MKRVSITRKMIAVLGILAIFAGTQGFVISSHTCNSCGTHEESISLFGIAAGNNHECQAEETGSCCPAGTLSEEPHNSCCVSEATDCDKIDTELCCEFDSERITVETLSIQKTTNTEILLQPATAETIINTPDPGLRTSDSVALFHNKHCSGRDITRLTCCLLI